MSQCTKKSFGFIPINNLLLINLLDCNIESLIRIIKLEFIYKLHSNKN